MRRLLREQFEQIMRSEPTFARLSHRDYDACASAVARIYGATSLSAFPTVLLPLLLELVPADHVGYNDFDARENRYVIHSHPHRPEIESLSPQFGACFHTHPLIDHYQKADPLPTKISDVVSFRQFQEIPLYQEYFRHVGTNHQMIFFLHSNKDQRIGISLNRGGTDFSERDRSVLGFLSPHIARAYNNAQRMGELTSSLEQVGEGLGAMRRAVILTDTDGSIRWLSPLAREWLAEFFEDFAASPTFLPSALRTAVVRVASTAAPGRPKVLEWHATARGCRLLVHCEKTRENSQVIALERERTVIAPATSAALGLTGREAEILFWISESKTNPEIAMILKISPRTIHKHVEHLFAKLNVANRLEAQRLGLELRRI